LILLTYNQISGTLEVHPLDDKKKID